MEQELRLVDGERLAPYILQSIGGYERIVDFLQHYSLFLQRRAHASDMTVEVMSRRLYGLLEYDRTRDWEVAETYFLQPIGSTVLLPASIRYRHLKQVADSRRAASVLDAARDRQSRYRPDGKTGGRGKFNDGDVDDDQPAPKRSLAKNGRGGKGGANQK